MIRSLSSGGSPYLVFDGPDHHRHFTALFEDVDPETTDALKRQRQIHFQFLFKNRNLAFVHQGVCDLLDHTRRQPRLAERE